MTTSTNVLALDVGGRRIGVAIASLDARIASPLMTLDTNDSLDIFTRLNDLIDEHKAIVVIVGLPRGLEGQETAQTASTREFAQTLQAKCHVKVHLQDEAVTSLAAKDDLDASGKTYQKADIDKLAAAYILRDWLLMTESQSS